jgi:SAM-dependent methyltransferase
MPETAVVVHGRTFTLPSELDALLGASPRLRIVPQQEGFAIMTLAPRDRLKDAGKRVLGRARWPAARRVDRATYLAPTALGDGTYGVANHDPVFFLLPLDSRSDGLSRESFWAGVDDYHEHRALAEQNEAAHATSAWLASEVLQPLGSSFLEVGCGAGRNLAQLQGSIVGLDINAGAVALARERLPHADIRLGSLYDLDLPQTDVVFTSGVLMHVPHSEVVEVVQRMVAQAARAVVHLELHGEAHGFDYHRYPRDYGRLYRSLGLDARYEVIPAGDGRWDANGTGGLLVHTKA